MASNSPISVTRLRQICNDACDSAISAASVYEHSQTQAWNNAIINNVLKALISESAPAPDAPSRYKFIVNTTIIQHLSDPRGGGAGGGSSGSNSVGTGTQTGSVDSTPDAPSESVSVAGDPAKKVGRRGMHSASGAFWNNEKDGLWSHKYEGGEGKGMDIVISVMWVAV